MKVLSPFGPKIAIVKIPKKIINNINWEVDKIIGDKKRLSMIKEKKSMIMTPLRFVFSFFEMYRDEKKLRNNITIKNSLIKTEFKINMIFFDDY